MAQYRLSVSIISRKEGRSATAMAAYRAGILMEDRRTGERFDFTRRSGVLHSEMVLPANAPAWASDRAEFWNRSELAEVRQKAQVAREIQLSLPHELTGQQRQELTLTFAEHVTARYGLAVDVNIHAPGRHGDQRNHHAHLLLCTRPFDADSKTGFGNKNRDLDMIACKRSGKATEVEQLRAVWEEYSNQALEQANIRTSAGDLVQLDRRSYERQGSEQEPTVKLGPAASGLKRRGEDSERAAINDDIQERNALRRQLAATLEQTRQHLTELQSENLYKEEPPAQGSGGMMHMDEEERRKEEERLQSWRAAFETFVAERAEQDRRQEIGKTYLFEADPTRGPLIEQYREWQQKMSHTLDENKDQLNRQNAQERDAFDDWMQAQRDAMREQDRAEARQQGAEVQLPPGYSYRGFTDPLTRIHKQREDLRSIEEVKMRDDFREYQKGVNQHRHEVLARQNDQNEAQLERNYQEQSHAPEQTTPAPRRAQTITTEQLNEQLNLARIRAAQERERDRQKEHGLER